MPVMQQFAPRFGDAPRWENLDESRCRPANERVGFRRGTHSGGARAAKVRLVPLRGLLGFISSWIKC